MRLTFGERFVLIGLLPEQGNFLLLKRCVDAKSSLMPTEQEIEDYSISQDESGRIIWSGSDYQADIDIGETVTDKIREILKEKNNTNSLRIEELGLYEKFVM